MEEVCRNFEGERDFGMDLSVANGTMAAVSSEVRPDGASSGLQGRGRLPGRPVLLAPPFRVASDLDAPVLRLQTIQTPAAYEALRRNGILAGDPALGDADFAEAYDWMRWQMAARLPTSGDGILWLWAKTTYRDLVGNARHARGDVLLTVRVPRERVLLSHFGDWHTVLNRGPDVPLLPGETIEEWIPRGTSCPTVAAAVTSDRTNPAHTGSALGVSMLEGLDFRGGTSARNPR